MIYGKGKYEDDKTKFKSLFDIVVRQNFSRKKKQKKRVFLLLLVLFRFVFK